MRAKNSSSSGVVDQPAPTPAKEPGSDIIGGLIGGLRLRGMVGRRMRRSLKEDLELVTYIIISENGTYRVEEFSRPGGPYYNLGSLVDHELEVRSYCSKDGQTQTSLRSVRYAGEF